MADCLPEVAAQPAWVPEVVDFYKVAEAVRQAVAERSIVPAAQPGSRTGGANVQNRKIDTQKIAAPV